MMEKATFTAGAAVDLEDFHWMRPGRAPIACQHCRNQRIRCDVTLRKGSCTNCEFYDVQCQVVTGKRRSKKGPSSLVAIPASEVYIPLTSGAVEPTRNSISPQPTLPLTEKPAHILDDEFVLLRNKGVFDMPSASLRHQIVQAYLRHIYSRLPIVSFQDLLSMVDPGRQYSNWLVFMALCSISVIFIDKDGLREMGVTSAKSASQKFFTKAETLYRFQWHGHHEYCTLQALLFLAFCEKEVYGKDGWSWTWAAYTTAVQMGLDRKPAQSDRQDLGLRRRLWWTCYSQCTLLNLHTAFPRSIKLSQSEIPLPTEEDFEPIKPIYCLRLIPALVAAQKSSVSFVQRVNLVHTYNEYISTQQNHPYGGHAARDIVVELGDISGSATDALLKRILDQDAALKRGSVCDLATSPLDAGSNHQPLNSENHESDTVGMFLDLERVLYNCTSISDLEVGSGNPDKTV